MKRSCGFSSALSKAVSASLVCAVATAITASRNAAPKLVAESCADCAVSCRETARLFWMLACRHSKRAANATIARVTEAAMVPCMMRRRARSRCADSASCSAMLGRMNSRSRAVSWRGLCTIHAPGARQLEPSKQRVRFLLRCCALPVNQILLQLSFADQEFALIVEPFSQQAPLAQQRLVRYLIHSHPLLLEDGEQACFASFSMSGRARGAIDSMGEGRRTYSPSGFTRTMAGINASLSACKSSSTGLAVARPRPACAGRRFQAAKAAPAPLPTREMLPR
jgi:hypothetical protein